MNVVHQLMSALMNVAHQLMSAAVSASYENQSGLLSDNHMLMSAAVSAFSQPVICYSHLRPEASRWFHGLGWCHQYVWDVAIVLRWYFV